MTLEERAAGVSWTEALDRVARKLLLAQNVADTKQPNPSLKTYGAKEVQRHFDAIRNRAGDPRSPEAHAIVVQALDMCSRGVFPPLARGDKEAELALQLIQLNVLDYVSAATLVHSQASARTLDTIQFVNQCRFF